MYVCVCTLSHSVVCDPLDFSPPGSSVHGIFQARVLEWAAITTGNWTCAVQIHIIQEPNIYSTVLLTIVTMLDMTFS